ncbi:MAG: hypothetical protein J6J42_00500 [Lachnospiraceae bacterium]|nr:hypothetical protein [Lachnospiraceae bacterium]
MSTIYQKFKKLPVSFSALGLEQFPAASDYFCTPEGAELIGWAGVDGIHYCFIREFGEMVFAVSPCNLPGDYVHPLAYNFEEFLRLMLACHGLDAAEQAHAWGKDMFEKYLEENPVTQELSEIFSVIQEELGLTPMEQPFEYIKKIQNAFDYTKLQFSEEYWEYVPQEAEVPGQTGSRRESEAGEEKQKENPACEAEEPLWEVYFGEGVHYRHSGRIKGEAGTELPVNKQFFWNGNVWHVPSVYVCGKGLVVDFCVEIEPEKIKEFLEKIERYGDREELWSEEIREEMHRTNPTDLSFRAEVKVNGRELKQHNGRGFGWMPQELFKEEVAWPVREEEERLLKYYQLDRGKGWYFRRASFVWATAKKPVIKEVELTMKAEEVSVTAERFTTLAVGESVKITRSATGEEYTLTVQAIEEQQLAAEQMERVHHGELEFPCFYKRMLYTLSPDLPGTQFLIQDCVQSDQPRKKPVPGYEPMPGRSSVASIAVIGGADGPTAFFIAGAGGTEAKQHVACSALHFEPVETIKWKAVFREKLCEDVKVKLL